jgi:hypothetical protein
MFHRSLPVFLAFAACSDQSVGRFNTPPEAAITSHEDGAVFLEGYAVELRGSASDADGQTLTAAWYVGSDEVCAGEPEADGTTRCEIVFGAGDTDVTLEVRDAEGAADGDSITFSVTPTESPVATLIRPDGTGPYYDDRPIEVVAQVSDGEDDPAQLIVRLTSDRDGDLAVSAPDAEGDVSGYVSLSAGTHVLTLSTEDTTGKTGSDSILVDVGPPNSAPACAITAPADGSAGIAGEVVRFEATVSDPDVSPGLLAVSWSSDRDGSLGSSTPTSDGSVVFPTSALSTGTHLVTLAVEDDQGLVCTDVIVYAVDTPPSVTIVSPSSGSTAREGEIVTFEATVADAEDAATALSVEWTSDLDGVLSTADADAAGTVAFTSAGLSAGAHTLRVTVTDTHGLAASDLAVLTVVANSAPEVLSISLSPTSPKTDDTITALVTTSDADGDPVSVSYAWTVDGVAVAASGSSLSGAYFSRDQEVAVTATPFDATEAGAPATASVVVVNSPPTAPVVQVTPASATAEDDLVCAISTASTDADGDPIAYTFAWDADGAVYPVDDPAWIGPDTTTWPDDTVPAEDTEDGETWTCTVTPDDGDDFGAAGTASVTLEATDYTDLWTLDKTVSYTCAYGLVSISFDQVSVVHTDPNISISSTGSGSQPGTMTGTIASDAFTTSRTLPGGCTETYTFDGTFSDPYTFSATFKAAYSGSCFGCTTRSWTVAGTR